MKILITGDYCPIGRAKKLLLEKNYNEMFNGYEKILKTVDFSIVNFECPLTTSTQKVDKTGPCLKTEDINSLKALKFVGFDLMTLANNHIQDYGGKGVLDTIENIGNEDLEYVGAGADKKLAEKPFIKVIKGLKVGFINIAENEFCAAENDLPGANTFDFIDNTRLIKELKSNVDKIILIYHGGREHYQLPTPEQRKRLRYFISCGVDAIIAHHTHCFSGYEFYENKPIIYSLGNFIFDYKKKYQQGLWTEGMSVILNLEDGEFKVELIPHLQGRKNDFTLKILEGLDKEKFLDRVDALNKKLVDDTLFYETWREYLKTQENFYFASFYLRNFFLRALFIKGFLPVSWLKSKHKLLLLNLLRCETHYEISKNILKK
jgi:poly-gamma-glutamate synthesis protein (capsule biosynthesis protein)